MRSNGESEVGVGGRRGLPRPTAILSAPEGEEGDFQSGKRIELDYLASRGSIQAARSSSERRNAAASLASAAKLPGLRHASISPT